MLCRRNSVLMKWVLFPRGCSIENDCSKAISRVPNGLKQSFVNLSVVLANSYSLAWPLATLFIKLDVVGITNAAQLS